MDKVEIDLTDSKVIIHLRCESKSRIRIWIADKLIKLASIIGDLGWGGLEEITDG